MDSAVTALHAYWLLCHGGELNEDCKLCNSLMTIGKAMEARLEAEPVPEDT